MSKKSQLDPLAPDYNYQRVKQFVLENPAKPGKKTMPPPADFDPMMKQLTELLQALPPELVEDESRPIREDDLMG